MYRRKRSIVRKLLLAGILAGASACAPVPQDDPAPPAVELESEEEIHEHEHEGAAALSWVRLSDYDNGIVEAHALELEAHAEEPVELEFHLHTRVAGRLEVRELGRQTLQAEESAHVAVNLRDAGIDLASLQSPAEFYVRAHMRGPGGESLGFAQTSYLFVLPSDGVWQVASEAGLRADEGLAPDDTTPVLVGEGQMLPDVLVGDPAQDGPPPRSDEPLTHGTSFDLEGDV